MSPFCESLKAIEKLPVEASPQIIGVSATSQVFPRLVDRKTRATLPPVAIQTLLRPSTVMQVPLAANAPSPSLAAGIFISRGSFQVAPPSVVLIMTRRPSTGSLTAIPLLTSQNAIASKNAFGFRLVN